MDKEYKKKLQEELRNYNELKNESHFSAEEFTEEISVLLPDYFRGEFKFNGQAIICSFENGQKFKVVAEEMSP